MKLSSITSTACGSAPQRNGRHKVSDRGHLLIEVRTDAVITGWRRRLQSHHIAATKTALESYVGPWSIGKDPTAIGAPCPMMRRIGVPFAPNLS